MTWREDAQSLATGSLDPVWRSRRREATRSLNEAVRAGNARAALTIYCPHCERSTTRVYATPVGYLVHTVHPTPGAKFDAGREDGQEVTGTRTDYVDTLDRPSSLPMHPEQVPGWCKVHGLVLVLVVGLRDLLASHVTHASASCASLAA